MEKKRKLHSRLGVDESQARAEYVPSKTPYIVPTKKIRLHETTVSSTKDGKQKKLKSCLKRSKSTGGSKRVNWPEDKRQRLTQVRQVEGLNSNMGQNAAGCRFFKCIPATAPSQSVFVTVCVAGYYWKA